MPVIEYSLDLIGFVVLTITFAAGIEVFLRRRHSAALGRGPWILVFVLLIGAFGMVKKADRDERSRLKSMLGGYARTFAAEMAMLGHADLPENISADDPTYLRLIEHQRAWLAANREIADVYTMRRTGEDSAVFVVDSETDDDADGQITGEREQRTAPGEPYEPLDGAMKKAFNGDGAFDETIVEDRWGHCVGAAEPIRRKDGSVEAILGIDFSADAWIDAVARARLAALTMMATFVLAVLIVAAAYRIAQIQAAVIREIELRRTAERQMRCSDRYAEAVFTNVPDALAILDAEGKVLAANRAVVESLEVFIEGDVVARPIFDFVHDDDRRIARSLLSTAIEKGSGRGTFRLVSTTGTERQFEAEVLRLDIDSLDVHDFLFVAKDVTRQRSFEVEAARLQRELVAASRRAGMAEVATGVLHNVGNVLNSVCISAEEVAMRLDEIRLEHLKRAVQMAADFMKSNSASPTDDTGKKVVEFLGRFTDHLGSERDFVVGEMKTMMLGLGHLKEIVAIQQSLAGEKSTVAESVDPETLVEDALRVERVALERHGIEVDRRFESVGEVRLDRHKIIQVLVNLITNAKNAMLESRSDKRITISIRVRGDESRPTIVFAVADNGVGIPRENLTRVFAFGFTTRKEGSGFGLHASANAAAEMGGTLTAQSAGVGQGAEFSLEIPFVPAEEEVPCR